MRHHGVPDAVIADSEGFWDYIRDDVRDASTPTCACADGDRSAPAAATCASLAAPATARPTRCSSTTRDRLAFVGDHLLGRISSNTEIYPAVEPDGHAPARARRVPGQPAADRRACRCSAC